MAEENNGIDISAIVRQAVEEFARAQSDPALSEERKRREELERRVDELVEENRRDRQAAEEAQASAAIRAELQRLGVAKIDLVYKAVREDIARAEDGRLVSRGPAGEVDMKQYLAQFVNENPEFLPARISGGSGAPAGQKTPASGGAIDLDRIKPGMSKEEMERVRQEIIRLSR